MLAFHPPNLTVPDTAPDDPRVGTLLGEKLDDPGAARVVLLGFPSDEGVRRNGGRTGAAHAPDAIRQALFKMTPDARVHDAFVDLLVHTADLGNLALGGTMEDGQERLGEALEPFLLRGAVPVLLGGGHETSYGHFLGYVQARQPVAILNVDAHADVRPLKGGRGHSGSPFRQALEHPSGLCDGYTVAGLLPHSTAKAHLDFLRAHRGRFFWNEDLTPGLLDALFAHAAGTLMVTFDLDAVDQAQAPGVSAPAAGGLAPDLWLRAAYEAGRCPHVASFDLVEYNPAFDVDHRAARLAALTVWNFLRGLAERSLDSSRQP